MRTIGKHGDISRIRRKVLLNKNTHVHVLTYHTLCIYVSLLTDGAPPCRTTHAADAAGAAPNLGAIL
jgi:hypothetical protein